MHTRSHSPPRIEGEDPPPQEPPPSTPVLPPTNPSLIPASGSSQIVSTDVYEGTVPPATSNISVLV